MEAVLLPWVRVGFGVDAGHSTPPDLEKRLPFVRVERLGGADGRFTAHPRIAVDVFGRTADEASHLSDAIRDSLVLLHGPVGGAVIRGVRCISGPSRQPWANPSVYRRGASYSVSLRAA
ncbi:hypothetical protein [Streptomyces sp. NPDC020141]|uniref:hypothetical protein n=1 Tax=Streptomyces sp. NPDC020141 TaxID=3365065 RepID=UPI0037AA921A